MGFMDKVKAQTTVLAEKAQAGVQQGQVKLQEMQSGKQADHLLRELGAYVFLSERGRTPVDSEAKVAELLAQLDAAEAAGTPVTVTPEPSAAPAPGTAPEASAPPPPPAPPAPDVPPAPPAASTADVPAVPAARPAPSAPPAPPAPPAGGGIPQSSSRLPGQ